MHSIIVRALSNRWIHRAGILCILSISTFLYAQEQSATKVRLSTEQIRQVQSLIQKGLQNQEANPQAAVTYFSQALQIVPQEPTLYIYRGRVYLINLKNFAAAKQDFDRAIALSPKFAPGYFLRGACYLDMQLLPEAEADFQTVIKLDSKNYDAYRNLGVIQTLRQKYADAITTFTKAIRLRPQESSAYYERANGYRSVGKYKEAIEDYSRAIQRDPRHFDAYLNRANSKANIKNYQGAIEDYTYIINNAPNNKKLMFYNRGQLFNELGRHKEAETDLDEAIKLDSSFMHAHATRLLAILGQKKFETVVKEARATLQHNPQDAAAFNNAGGAVHAQLQQSDFINDIVFSIRAQARAALGDKAGACIDMRKAAILGYPQAAQELATYCSPSTLFEPSSNFPEHAQFFPREANDSANVQLSGVLLQGGYDSAYAELFRNGVFCYRVAAPIQYFSVLRGVESVQHANISLTCPIRAELAEYSVRFGVKSAAGDAVLAQRDSLVCGDVYFVSGQSNAVLGKVSNVPRKEFLRTFYFGHNDSFWGVAEANNNADDYNVGGLALQMMSRIADEQKIPVCVLNGALSASTIEQHFRRNEAPDDPKSWYARMRWRAKASGLWKAAKAMVWYQGESNQGAGYTEKFAQLYNAWKQDYSNLQKIYVVQIRPSDCGQTDHALLRERQRRLPSQFPDVELIASVGIPSHDGCHFGDEGYIELGNRLYGLVRRDFYQNASQNVPAFYSPSLQKARWISVDKKELALEFAPSDSLVATPDTLVGGILRTLANDAFLLDGAPVKASSVRIEKNIVRLSFAAPQTATRISYIPDRCYADAANAGSPCVVYQGPWLVSPSHRLAAPTFHDVLIEAGQ